MSENQDQQTAGISRRTVTKAAAWAVPVIAVAATTPMAAASDICLSITAGPEACKTPGQSGNDPWFYHLQLCFKNTCTTGPAIAVVITGAETVSGVTVPGFTGSFNLLPGDTQCIGPVDFCSTNSAGAILVQGTLNGVTIPTSGNNAVGRIPAGPNDLAECVDTPSICG